MSNVSLTFGTFQGGQCECFSDACLTIACFSFGICTKRFSFFLTLLVFQCETADVKEASQLHATLSPQMRQCSVCSPHESSSLSLLALLFFVSSLALLFFMSTLLESSSSPPRSRKLFLMNSLQLLLAHTIPPVPFFALIVCSWKVFFHESIAFPAAAQSSVSFRSHWSECFSRSTMSSTLSCFSRSLT